MDKKEQYRKINKEINKLINLSEAEKINSTRDLSELKHIIEIFRGNYENLPKKYNSISNIWKILDVTSGWLVFAINKINMMQNFNIQISTALNELIKIQDENKIDDEMKDNYSKLDDKINQVSEQIEFFTPFIDELNKAAEKMKKEEKELKDRNIYG